MTLPRESRQTVHATSAALSSRRTLLANRAVPARGTIPGRVLVLSGRPGKRYREQTRLWAEITSTGAATRLEATHGPTGAVDAATVPSKAAAKVTIQTARVAGRIGATRKRTRITVRAADPRHAATAMQGLATRGMAIAATAEPVRQQAQAAHADTAMAVIPVAAGIVAMAAAVTGAAAAVRAATVSRPATGTTEAVAAAAIAHAARRARFPAKWFTATVLAQEPTPPERARCLAFPGSPLVRTTS